MSIVFYRSAKKSICFVICAVLLQKVDNTSQNNQYSPDIQVLRRNYDNLNQKSNNIYPSKYWNVNARIPSYIGYSPQKPNFENNYLSKHRYDRVYPTNIAQDRFAPGEAYAFSIYPRKKAKKEAVLAGNTIPAPAVNCKYLFL